MQHYSMAEFYCFALQRKSWTKLATAPWVDWIGTSAAWLAAGVALFSRMQMSTRPLFFFLRASKIKGKLTQEMRSDKLDDHHLSGLLDMCLQT